MTKYTIPAEIKERIPDYFYIAMAGELVSIFGPSILELNNPEDEECSYYDLYSGTGGWNAAWYMACKKLDMMWLHDYYKSLPTYVESDLFDYEIEKEIIERIRKGEFYNLLGNSYYHYIIIQDFSKGVENESS